MKKDFDWSLSPLSICLQFSGIPLNWSTKKNRWPKKLFPFCLILAIIVTNVIINGPRGIEISRFKFMEVVYDDKFESPFVYLKENPFAIVKLVTIIADMAFFCYVPFIHVTFVAMVLFDPSWKRMIETLDKIQRVVSLNEEFYKKMPENVFLGAIPTFFCE